MHGVYSDLMLNRREIEMSTAFAIRTIIEIIAIVLVIVGVLNEQKIIKWEDKMIKKIKRKIYFKMMKRNIGG